MSDIQRIALILAAVLIAFVAALVLRDWWRHSGHDDAGGYG